MLSSHAARPKIKFLAAVNQEYGNGIEHEGKR
jgi:hypothetical protein